MIEKPNDHSHAPDFHETIRRTHDTAAESYLKAHLSIRHGATGLSKLTQTQAEALHRTKHEHDAGPTIADHAAGLIAVNQAAIAGALRILASKHLGEMDHAHLPMPDGDAVSIVTTAEVQSFLEGWAIRIENGVDL